MSQPVVRPAQDELRLARLRGDLVEMTNIRGPLIDWRASGDAPATYQVRYYLTSFVAPDRSRASHRVSFVLPETYPLAAPYVRMLDLPVYHPNIFLDGRICLGNTWNPEEGLAFLVIRVARMLLYYPDVTNARSPANLDAAAWYLRQAARFPLGGKIAFPDPLTRHAGESRPLTITRKWKPA